MDQYVRALPVPDQLFATSHHRFVALSFQILREVSSLDPEPKRSSSPSLFSRMLGANPPSSPTLVASWPYFSWITPFRVWYSSAPILKASLRSKQTGDGGRRVTDVCPLCGLHAGELRLYLKDSAPTGNTINSCMASLFPAWEPPFITLKA